MLDARRARRFPGADVTRSGGRWDTFAPGSVLDTRGEGDKEGAGGASTGGAEAGESVWAVGVEWWSHSRGYGSKTVEGGVVAQVISAEPIILCCNCIALGVLLVYHFGNEFFFFTKLCCTRTTLHPSSYIRKLI